MNIKKLFWGMTVLIVGSCSSPIYRPIFYNTLETSEKGEIAILGAKSFEGVQGNVAYSPIDKLFIRAGYYTNFTDDRYKAFNLGVGYYYPLEDEEEFKLDFYSALDFSKVKADRYTNNQTFEYQKLYSLINENISISSGIKASVPLFSKNLTLDNKLGLRFLNFNIKEIILRLPSYEDAVREARTYDGKILVDLNYEFQLKYKDFSLINGLNYGLYKKGDDYLHPLELWTGIAMTFGGKKNMDSQ